MKTFTLGQQTKTVMDWSKDPAVVEKGITYSLLYTRHANGWDAEKALTTPPRKKSSDVNGRCVEPPEAPPPLVKPCTDSKSIERLLADAQNAKLRCDVQARRQRVDELKRRHADSMKHLESWRARLAVIDRQRSEYIKRRDALCAAQQYVPASEYAKAKGDLERDIENYTRNVKDIERGTKAHESRVEELMGELESLQCAENSAPTTPTADSSRCILAATPHVKLPNIDASPKRTTEPQTKREWQHLIDMRQGAEWELIRQHRSHIWSQRNEIASHAVIGNQRVVQYMLSLLAGKQRKLQAATQDPLARKAAYVVGGAIGWMIAEFKPAYIEVFNSNSPERDWDLHCAEQQRLLDAALVSAKRQPDAVRKPNWHPVPEVPAHVESCTDEEVDRLIKEIAPKVREFRIAVFGGTPERNSELLDWLEQRLKFAKVRCFSETDACCQSIRMRGADVLLLLLRGVQHKDTIPVTNSAKAASIPIAVSPGTSKAECARAILKVLK